MSLAPGSRLAHYQILSPLGSGGMGEVYRAQDTRLDREVAIKVLPESFATDADRVARFEREAKTLGALNHPNVATLHGLEHVDGTLALVMELVPGETLAERIERGRIPMDEALSVARQIAEALDAAHDHGIVHRDLKPANVKVRDDGTVKVLDFGLAKALERTESSGAPGSAGVSLMNPPTVTSPATAAGIILGTASYMSPEQARGRVVDKRTDIWAFGCVLFEMLSGRRAFPGSDVAEVIGATIHKEPDWQALPVSTPPAVRATLERCLQKDPRQRARDIGDVRFALEGGFAGASTPAAQRTSSSRGPALVLAALLGAIAAGLAVWIAGRSPAAAPPETRLQVAAPDGFRYASFFSISPNGRYLVFLATDPQTASYRFWMHSFDTGESRQLTSPGITNSSQFWSPDSRWFAFAQAGQLKRTSVEGGPPEVICSFKGSFLGGAWRPDNTILFATTASAIMRVSASGGTPTPVTTLAASREETAHSNPWFLPDGRHFIYLRLSARGDQSGIYVGSLDDAPGADPGLRLVATSVAAVFARATAAAPDRLLFTRDGALMVQPFDLRALRLTGEASVVADRVGISPASYAHMWASETGTLVYRRPDVMPGGTPLFVNRVGQPQGSIDGIGSRPVEYPRVSPDGTRVVMAVESELWSFDLTGRPPVKLTNVAAPQASVTYSPLWSLDGQRVVFEPPGSTGLLSVPADGSTTAPERIGPVGHYHPHGWIDGGRELLAVRLDQSPRGWGIVRLPTQTDGAAIEVLDTTSSEGYNGAVLSPDGRWLAYTTNATGDLEIWIRRMAEPASPVRVSAHGGTEPTWSQGGRELIYLEDDKFMRVPVTIAGDAISVGRPEQLFETAIVHAPQPPSYDVMPDGRILLLKPLSRQARPIEVILNWGGGR